MKFQNFRSHQVENSLFSTYHSNPELNRQSKSVRQNLLKRWKLLHYNTYLPRRILHPIYMTYLHILISRCHKDTSKQIPTHTMLFFIHCLCAFHICSFGGVRFYSKWQQHPDRRPRAQRRQQAHLKEWQVRVGLLHVRQQ